MKLSTNYMGLDLKNPLVPSAGPMSESAELVKRMEDAGAAAVVMFSIFQEQVQHEQETLHYLTTAGSESFAEALSYFPEYETYRFQTDDYLDLLQKTTEATDIPILGSMNGVMKAEWIEFAKKIQQTGVKGIELNLYNLATDPNRSGSDIEDSYAAIVKAIVDAVDIPVAVKISPFFSSTANMAQRFQNAGAKALVMFNRFYQPDIDIEKRELLSTLELSTPAEMLLPLRWIAILRGKVDMSLAATTGVHSAQEIVKYIMAGADVTMTTSALLKNGLDHIKTMLSELESWMDNREYESLDQIRGCMSHKSVSNPAAFERANYIKILEKYKNEYTL